MEQSLSTVEQQYENRLQNRQFENIRRTYQAI